MRGLRWRRLPITANVLTLIVVDTAVKVWGKQAFITVFLRVARQG